MGKERNRCCHYYFLSLSSEAIKGSYIVVTMIVVTLALWSSFSNAALFSCHLRHSSRSSIATRSKSSSRTSSLFAFPNLLPPNIQLPSFLLGGGGGGGIATTKNAYGDIELEDRLIATIENCVSSSISSNNTRLDISNEVSDIVSLLEASSRSVPRPAIAPQLYGRWKLLRTSNTDTASPIQRKAVDTSKFDIYQDIVIVDDKRSSSEDRGRTGLLVRQIVKFSGENRLCVDALGSTSAYPLDELTNRIGDGKILGVNVLGVSVVGENAAEDMYRPDSRLRFVFDEGRFELFDGRVNFPYPVPFRNPLFRDAVKGWIDITYLSDRIRISRGNKGTTFILRKVLEE